MTRRSVPLRLLAGAAVLALLAGGIAVAWPGADWLKPRIEAAARRATGRALKIRGPLRIGWNLAVDASDVSLANMPGGSQPEMARIGRVHAQLALPALLRGQFRISALSLIDPRILVERDAAGVVNWQLQRPAGPATPAAASGGWTPRFGFRLDHLTTKGGSIAWRGAHRAVADGERPLPAIDADFTGLAQPAESVPAGMLRWRSGPLPALAGAASQWPLSLAWNASDFVVAVSGGLTPPWPPRQYDLTATLTAAASGPLRTPRLQLRLRQGQPVQADLTGLLDQEELHATGTLGADALGGGAAPLQAVVTWAGAKATVAGTLAAQGGGLDGTVAAQVPDLARVAALVGRSSAIHGAIALDGHLVATRQRVAMTGMHLTMPGGDLAGDLAWTQGARPLVTGNLAGKQLDLAVLRTLPITLQPPAAATTAPPAAMVPGPKPTHIIPDQPLPFAGLRQLDADLKLQVARLAHPDLRDLSMHMLLRDGQLTLDPLSADAGGRLAGSVRIDARPAAPTVAVALHATALSVASLLQAGLLQAGGLAAAATGELSVDADLHGAGHTPHELAATLGGTATIASNGANFSESVLAGLLGTLHLPMVNLGSGVASLRCLAAGFNAAAGQVTVAPLVLDTSRLLVQGEGHVDLDAETFAMQMRPLLRTGPGIVIPLRLSGPWRAPKVSPEAGGLFGGHGPDPCAASLASLHAPAATAPPPPAKVKPPKPIDILRGLLR